MEIATTSNVPRRLKNASTSLLRGGGWLNDVLVRPVEGPARKAYALHRLCRALCVAHGFETRVNGTAPLGPKIFVANHLSYVDPIAICGTVPCTPIAKAEVAAWPLVGRMGARYNTIFVDRHNPFSGARALRSAVRLLAAGADILNFPEGTTTLGALRPFRRGIFGLARLAGVPVIPVRVRFESPELCWVDEETFVPHYLKTLRSKPHRVELDFGPALAAASFTSDQAHADAAREWIAGPGSLGARRVSASPGTEAHSGGLVV